MVQLPNPYGYHFDPETMYQPALPNIDYFDDGLCRFFPDGRVETLDPDWELEYDTYKGWNNYCQAGVASGRTSRLRSDSGPTVPPSSPPSTTSTGTGATTPGKTCGSARPLSTI